MFRIRRRSVSLAPPHRPIPAYNPFRGAPRAHRPQPARTLSMFDLDKRPSILLYLSVGLVAGAVIALQIG
ncbi:MAG: hypothetical protein OEV31_09355, partial [Gammaproteobacteria bacterium]|nr:hypothetical protein [Gammaproteobacteria bacterium]